MKAKLNKIAIALGGNLGDSKDIFSTAISRLAENGVKNIKLSPFIRSKPENCPPGSPDFTNAVLTGEWTASPQELLELCQQVEIAAGRPEKHGFNAPRTLDLDIILFADEIINTETLQIPHPRAAERLFVLEPLAKIAPGWIFPDSGKTVEEIKTSLLDKEY